jgi:hypothetical protein
VNLFAPKPNSQSYVVTQNDLVDEELGCVSCPEQIHIFVQPLHISIEIFLSFFFSRQNLIPWFGKKQSYVTLGEQVR